MIVFIVGSQNIEKDLVSSDDQRLDFDAYDECNIGLSVKSKSTSYLEAAKKSLEKNEWMVLILSFL